MTDLGVDWNLVKSPKVLVLTLRLLSLGWIKGNTDRLAKGNPGAAAMGRGLVFRNEVGDYIGGYGLSLGHQTTYYAKIMAVILAIEFAYAQG